MIFAPTGNLWLLNSLQSSWITGPLLLKVLDLARKHMRTSKEDSIITLNENHEKLFTLYSILSSRENAIS